MIFDTIDHAASYKGLFPALDAALDFLSRKQKDLPPVTPIFEEETYALLQTYTTHLESECVWEYHEAHLDLHYLLSGEECILRLPKQELSAWSDFDYTEDAAISREENPNSTNYCLQPGNFVVLFPQDAHKARCVWDKPCGVQKVVIKIDCSGEIL